MLMWMPSVRGMTVIVPRANGTLMARSVAGRQAGSGVRMWIMCLTWAYVLERAKGIEPS
jgi:hypothetical protein